MTVRTHPAYTAASQAEITSSVPVSEDGVTAYAVLQRTAWQLSLTSVAPLSANVIATMTGVGRWLRYSYRRRFLFPFIWNANDDLTGFDVGAGAPSGDGGDGTFDGARVLSDDATLGNVVVVQRSPGDGGSTDVELIRNRGGVFTIQATVSLAALTDFETATTAPADTAGLAGDYYFCRFTSIQSGTSPVLPLDLTVQLEIEE